MDLSTHTSIVPPPASGRQNNQQILRFLLQTPKNYAIILFSLYERSLGT